MHEEVKHPCVQHKLALIRDEDTGYKKFRELATEITMFLCYEALKEIEVKQVTVKTPLAEAAGHKIANELVVVPILSRKRKRRCPIITSYQRKPTGPPVSLSTPCSRLVVPCPRPSNFSKSTGLQASWLCALSPVPKELRHSRQSTRT